MDAPVEGAPLAGAGFAPEAAFLDCVHCGLCHSACPTYVELGTEADSPRGRIHLMHALQDGTLPLDAAAVQHLDLCLGCRGCETACPSGVHYGALIEAARPWIEERYRRPVTTRLRRGLALTILPYPRRLRLALAPLHFLERLGVLAVARTLLRQLPARWRYRASLLPDPLPAPAAVPLETPARGVERTCVQLLVGCVMPELFGDTVRSTLEVLARNGCRILAPADQVCCGALSLHAGDRATAVRLACANVDAFEPRAAGPAIPLVVNASGCGAMMKEYAALLADEPAHAERAARLAARVEDATELLVRLPLAAPRAAAPARRVAYHDPCHLAHAQGVRQPPRALLASLPGVTLVSMADEDLCCGSAGHYNVMHPDLAARLAARKVEAMRASAVDVIATANAGCALQLEAGLRAAGVALRVRHVLDLLADAYRG
ncbi:MAG: 4Fe-4S dicluster domain-containing protein [Deltaproteobacteria bacterium]|nr:4Fe-4S dicluster domain-containing protein [Deltaproteobacteria bacterium]